MTPVPAIIEVDRTSGIPPKVLFKEELTNSPVNQKDKLEHSDFGFDKTQFSAQAIAKQDLTNHAKTQEDKVQTSELPSQTQSLIQTWEQLFVATHHEEIDGYVKKIVEGKAYVVFETAGGPLERAVKLSKLEAIQADHQGALIRLVVEERGASMNVKFENLEAKGIATWRDKIKDEDLEKYNLLGESAFPRKPSKFQ